MELAHFLSGSPIAHKVKLPGKIVIQRAAYSLSEVGVMKNTGKYGPIPREEECCELEVNGIIIAKGKIVKKGGEFYFKVTTIAKGGNV